VAWVTGTGRRVAGGILLGLAAFLAIATVRVLLDGRRHFAEAEDQARRGARETALSCYEDAARSYLPGSPYPAMALHRMSLMARAAEMRGDPHVAIEIWEKVRRSVLATRHVFVPNEPSLERAERAIVRLRSADRTVAARAAGDSISRPDDPSIPASILLLLGLVLWIAGAAIVTLEPAAGDRSRARVRSIGWAACLGGLALWVMMSWLA